MRTSKRTATGTGTVTASSTGTGTAAKTCSCMPTRWPNGFRCLTLPGDF